MAFTHQWSLLGQTAKAVRFGCSACNLFVDFDKPGFGQPSSDGSFVPPRIEDYTGPCPAIDPPQVPANIKLLFAKVIKLWRDGLLDEFGAVSSGFLTVQEVKALRDFQASQGM